MSVSGAQRKEPESLGPQTTRLSVAGASAGAVESVEVSGQRSPQVPSVDVLLVQLGTPDAPETGAVRRYLREFLSDTRVVELPPALWWFILQGAVLPLRGPKSAEKYRSVWLPEGSPLMVWSQRQREALAKRLESPGSPFRVSLAMRYGRPGLPEVLERLRKQGLQRLIVVPMYPQFAASTTATVFDAIARRLMRWRDHPEIRTIRSFPDDPGYIAALARQVRRFQAQAAEAGEVPAEKLMFSFHGLPQRSVDLGDPYRRECEATAKALAGELGLGDRDWLMTFQSRFGAQKWLQPYTEPTLEQLAKDGLKRIDVFCPGFVCDCLETLEEIAMGARETFEHAGGDRLRYIPCLNDDDQWMDALAALVRRQSGGWLEAVDSVRG